MKRRSKLLGAVAGVAGAAAAGYVGGKLAASRSRRRADPYADHGFSPPRDAEHEVPTADGAALYAVERGEGVPVVMGHGVTLDHRVWTHQLEALPERGIRAVAFDQRGHGRSTSGDGFGVERLGDDLRSLLEHLDLRAAVLVGHSMGGIGVQAFAARHPDVLRERVAGVVLMSTLSRAARAWGVLDRFLGDGASERGDRAFGRVLAARDGGFVVTRLAFGRTPFASHVELTRRMISECAPVTRTGATRPLVGFDLHDGLVGLAVPTLVVCGTADLLTPRRFSEAMARRIAGARLELLPGIGHMPMLEAADEISDLLVDFASHVTSGGSDHAHSGAATGSR